MSAVIQTRNGSDQCSSRGLRACGPTFAGVHAILADRSEFLMIPVSSAVKRVIDAIHGQFRSTTRSDVETRAYPMTSLPITITGRHYRRESPGR